MSPWLLVAVAGLIGVAATLLASFWWLRRRHTFSFDHARQTFQWRREWLEAEFLSRAAASGKPRGLRWVDCDFDNDVAFARDRRTGHYRALVGVAIRFEAIVGGGMEEVEAVGNLKAATVVFRLDGPHWEADDRACFNLSPTQTIAHYQNELEPVE